MITTRITRSDGRLSAVLVTVCDVHRQSTADTGLSSLRICVGAATDSR